MGMLNISFVEFGQHITDFYEYMGRDKKPQPERMTLWFNQIKKYKSTEVIEAFAWMKDNLDSLPHNVSKQIKNAIFHVNKSKPEEQQPEFKNGMFGECEDCNGTGIFKYIYFDNFGNRYEPIIFCSRCNNYKFFTNDPAVPKMSASELSAAGYTYKPYNKCLLTPMDIKPIGKPSDIKNMAAKFGEGKRLNEGEKYEDRKIDPELVD